MEQAKTRGGCFGIRRAFRKSLLISILRSVFEGRRDLFKGLATDRSDYDWKTYPVVSTSNSATLALRRVPRGF